MDLDAFTFCSQITEENKAIEILIFKSVPVFFVIPYLFGVVSVVDNKITLGSKEKAAFEIDSVNKTVKILDKKNEHIIMFQYRR